MQTKNSNKPLALPSFKVLIDFLESQNAKQSFTNHAIKRVAWKTCK